MVYDAGNILEVKLAPVMQGKRWNWNPARSEALMHIQSQLPSVLFTGVDKAIWVSSKNLKYSCKAAWEDLRRKNPKVEWWSLVWYGLAIPKQAFILWLVFRHGLSTGEKLLGWGYGGMSLVLFAVVV